jgi:hypothetical protein
MSFSARAVALVLLGAAGGCAAFAGLGSSSNDQPQPQPGAQDGGGSADGGGGVDPAGMDGSTSTTDGGTADASSSIEILTDGGCALDLPFGTPIPVEGLNPGAYDTYGGFLSEDYQTLYFGRGSSSSALLYVAQRSTAGPFVFGALAEIKELNSGTFDNSPNLIADGLAIYFESDRTIEGGAGGRNLWSSSRGSLLSPWAPPSIATALNSDLIDEQPYLSPTGTTIYFASNRSGSQNMDLWWTSALPGDNYGVPLLVPNVNSASNDFHPVLSPDQTTLYFASDRPGGAGDYDIYVSTRTLMAATYTPPKLVTELNTASKDEPTWLSPDGCTMLLASTRTLNGNSTNVNIYVTSKPRL